MSILFLSLLFDIYTINGQDFSGSANLNRTPRWGTMSIVRTVLNNELCEVQDRPPKIVQQQPFRYKSVVSLCAQHVQNLRIPHRRHHHHLRQSCSFEPKGTLVGPSQCGG